MDKAEAKAEIERLRKEIHHHNYLYYMVGQPEVSDREFDRMLDRLIELEREHPEFDDPNSPSVRVGGTVLEGFETVAHEIPMLSIDKSYEAKDIEDWLKRLAKKLPGEDFRFYCDPKIDGVAVSLRYEGGALVRGVTRGDGVHGDDITANVRMIGSIPLELRGDAPDVVEVRGEIYMTRPVFESINAAITKDGAEPYKNPRNLTAGTLKSLDSKVVSRRKLSFQVHGLGVLEGAEFESHEAFVKTAREWGMPAGEHASPGETIDEIMGYINEFEEVRTTLDYDTDGVVIRVNSFARQQKLGTTSKAPRWAIAYKYSTEQGESRLLSVDFQVGKTGAITPRATMEPVDLVGTTVTHATLHNFDEIRRKDIRLGDVIVVEKAGEIIPYVVRSVAERRTGDEREIVEPAECPCCGAATERTEDQVVLRCPNLSCPDRLRAALRHFSGRRAMDIEGLGDKLIDQLVAGKMVTSFEDLYRLEADRLLELERMGKRKAEKLLEAIETSKSRGLGRLLNALCIPHVGESVAKLLARTFGSMDALRAATEDSLAEVEKIGPIMAREIVAWFAREDNLAVVEALAEAGVVMEGGAPKPEAVLKEGEEGLDAAALAGLKVVVTGTLERRTRDEVHALIEAAGGEVAKSVSKKTGLLVAGAKAGSKLAKAEKLGVEVISEDDLYTRLGLGVDDA